MTFSTVLRKATLLLSVLPFAVSALAAEFPLDVLPAEHHITHDEETGADLTFLTTSPARDTNLYFHERSWSSDSSFIILYSERAGAAVNNDPESGKPSSSVELLAYVVATGELVVLRGPSGSLGGATCALNRNSVFGIQNGKVVELKVRIEASANPKESRSKAYGELRELWTIPVGAGTTAVNESIDGRHVAIGLTMPQGDPAIYTVDTETGEGREVCRIAPPRRYMYHVQWSHTNPNLLSFAGSFPRLNVVDVRDGTITNPYQELPGELVTHEHWWSNDSIVFCGGSKPQPTEDSHVKVVDVHTGVVRILGAGSWWPTGTDEQIAKRNYWHCSGSDDGRWVVADSWHGDISLFEGKSCRTRVLTANHRKYGAGDHPHVGWDRKGKQVIFASHKLGDANVCVATIPEAWQQQNQ